MALLKKKKFIPGQDWIWYAPNGRDAFGEEEIAAVVKSLRSGWLTTGRITEEFERRVAALFGKKYGLFVNSGSSANLLALLASRLPRGGEIITPACNFNTTVSPIAQTGLIPVFIDVEPGAYTLDCSALEPALSKKTAAVLAPHLIGNFVDLPAIRRFCQKHKLVFIEDSCDTIGGKFAGQPSGRWSDITTTSFYASHVITAAGAGGMLLTNNKILRERARVLRDWGRGLSRHDDNIRSRLATYKIEGRAYDSAFVFVERGYNFRPTEMQAAFALAQLKRLAVFIKIRCRNFSRLGKFFAAWPDYFILPRSLPRATVNWLAFPLTIKRGAPFSRNTFVRFLETRKIQTRPLFSGNILKHPAYQGIKYRRVGSLANSQMIMEQSCLLGMHHGITDEMLDYIFNVVADFLKKLRGPQSRFPSGLGR